MDRHEIIHEEPLPGTAGSRTSGSLAGLLVLLSIALGILLIGGAGIWAHNSLLGRAEAVDAAWAQVESNFQRRADLVPRLVETVNRYVRHESELLTAVVRERGEGPAAARQALGDVKRAQRASAQQRASLAGAPTDADRLAQLAQNEADLGRGLRAVLALAEGYPELRSADQFLELQAQLEGSENRINVARMVFNDAVRRYNASLVQLPMNWVASAKGLQPRAYFQADAGARVAGKLGLE